LCAQYKQENLVQKYFHTTGTDIVTFVLGYFNLNHPVVFRVNPSQSYEAPPAIWNHTVLPATRHRWTRPAIIPAREAGTRFTYPGGMKGWVDRVLVIYRDGLPVHGQSPIHVVTYNYFIFSAMPHR